MSTILVYSHDEAARKELVSKAAEIGDAKVATADGMGLPDGDTMTVAAGLAKAAEAAGATLVMVAADKPGKDIGPRVAAHLDWPFAGEVQELKDDDGWVASRMVLSGNSLATYRMGEHAVVTVTPGTFEDTGGSADDVGAVEGVEASPVKVTGTKGEEGGDFDLGAADYVVGVGRGFKAQDDLKLADALAEALPGGAVGCSRPISADLGWLGEEHWIGLSGHEIKPKVYFACGISGQIQHVAGIRGSQIIVAVNTNKDAPIVGVADYAIIDDLYDVLPELTEALG